MKTSFLSKLLSLSLAFTFAFTFIGPVFASDPGIVRFSNDVDNKFEWMFKVFGYDEVNLKMTAPQGIIFENAEYDADNCDDVSYEGNVIRIRCVWEEQIVKDLTFSAGIKLDSIEAPQQGDVTWSFDSKNYDNGEGILGFVYAAEEGELEAMSETGDSTGIFQSTWAWVIVVVVLVALLLAFSMRSRR